jgi:hypothetical protein
VSRSRGGCERSIPLGPNGGFVPDPCIGFIPGALSACCGHGDRRFAHVALGSHRYDNQVPTVTLSGDEALAFYEPIRGAERGSMPLEVARWLAPDNPEGDDA